MIYLFFWLACAGVTCYVADKKGRGVTEGVLLGFLLGIIGLAIELCLPTHHKPNDDRSES